MNKINSLHERDVSFPDLKKKVKKSLLQRLLLFNFLVVSICSMWSQTAPSISYASPQNYLWNAAITTLAPVNSGGSVPALNYKQVSTLAGTTSGFLDGTGTAAKMDGPLGMTMDASGNVYFVDSANFRIRKMTPAGVVTTIAGDGYSFLFYGRLRNNAVGSAASFSWPSGIVLDTANNCLYVADKENDVIRKVSLTGTFAVTTFAGSGTSSSLDGIGTAATFKKPNGIAIDPTNTYLYVTDRTGNKIRRITIGDAQVLTIAGSGTASTVDNATGTSATFNEPTGIAVDANFIYVSDFGGNKIRRIALTAPYAVITFAGSGTASSLNGMGAGATFDGPFGITLDGAGNLFVAEWGNKIRKITPDQIVTTIAGNGVANSVDGNGTAAAFNNPSGIVINPTTSVAYVSEWTGDRIRKLELGGYTLEIELGGNYEASSSLPSGLTLNKLTGSITGIPTTINNGPLFSSITAFNYYGSSSTSIAITTGTIPTLTTTVASTLTHNTASTGGNVTANGGSTLLEKGICWSTTANPTILDTKVVDGTSTTGSYTAAITGLSPTTTYYTRAYATNVFGTSYGTQVSFTTLISPPTISYTASNTFIVNTPITALQVSNTGGAIGGTYDVSLLAGSMWSTLGYINGNYNTLFNNPQGIATDSSGNVYVADTDNHAIRKITSGIVSTLAGGIGLGYADGLGEAALFNSPQGIATDAAGNVYVSDTGNNRIRKITASGNVTTLAGDNTSSIFSTPRAIAVDGSGNIYVADFNNHRIQKITASGIVTTLAGSGGQGSIDGIGTSASFRYPYGITVDSFGNVYVAQHLDDRIRKITPEGVVTTFAGSVWGFTDGTGTAAKFNGPRSVTTDVLGNVYVIDSGNHKIRKITPAGVVTTVAGSSSGFADGTGAIAQFNSPAGIASDALGNLYVTELSHKIRKLTPSDISISPALPSGLVLNADGSISGTPTVSSPATDYIVTATNSGGSSSFTLNLAITTIPTLTTTAASAVLATSATAGGNVISDGYSLLSERGVCWSTSPNPTIADAKTTDPTGMGPFTSSITGLSPVTTYYVRAYATNSVGTAYGNQIVVNTPMYAPVISYSSPNAFLVNAPITALAVSNIGGAIPTQLYGVSTVAGGNEPGSADGALGTALLSNPTAVVKDSQGNLFVADYYNHGIRKIAPNGIVSFYAGGSGPGYADGPRANSSFKNPFGLAIDHLDNLYVSEPLAHTIRKITASGIVSTFAGTYGVSNSDNLSFNSPRGLTCDAAGNVYVIDAGNSRIQKISPNGIMSIIFVGVAVGVSYNMVFDSVGNLLLANESYNGGVKKIDTNGVLTNTLFGTTTKSIAIDQSDNIYTANQWGNIIKTTPSGATSNITSGGIGFADGDFAVAKFKGISGLYLDQEGLLYVADTDNNRIRLVSQFGYSVTPALPAGLALNPDGSITGTPNVATAAKDYVVTATNSGGSSSNTLNFAITTIPSLTTTEASAITAITATLGGNVTSDGYASVAARGVCWSTSPNPTIADAKTTNGTGTGIFESAITGLSPVTAYYVRAYATNSVGTVYGNEFSFTTVLPLPIIQYSAAVTYAVNTAITPLAVSNTGGLVINSLAGVSTFAGSTAGYTDGTTNAQFSQPSGVVTDRNGNLFVADSSNNAIRKITPSGTVSTFAGGTSGTADGQGSAAQFLRPNSIAIDSNDNLYISDTGNHLIRKITASGLVSTHAGTAGTAGFVNGTGTSAQFNYPYGLTLDVSGNVYVADNVNNSIRKITPAGVVSTYFVVDYMLRTLDSPTAVAFDSSGNLFVSQASSNGLVKILIIDSYSELTNFDNNDPIGTITFDTNNTLYAAAGGFIVKAQEPYTSGTLFAGGSQGFADGALLEAKFGGIRGLTIDNEGVMYVADGVNNRIRKISPFGYLVSPALPSGLVLNANGSITGTPTEASPATDYVVTATNSGGSSSYTLNLAVQDKPSVQTIDAIHILSNYADSGVTVISDNQSTITTIGVCWSTSINPTIANDLNSTTDITQVYFPISGLTPSTTYYYRAFATNGLGTGYGDELSFTTLASLVASPVIFYNTPAVTYSTNSAIEPLVLYNTGGAVQSYSVSPTLPAGLTLNADGNIIGTPTEASAATDYVVTATNSGGSSSYTISITVEVDFVYTTLLVTVSQNNVLCYGGATGSATAIPSGGLTPYTYSWINLDGPYGEVNEISTNATVTGLPTGNYLCIIRDAINNSVQQEIIISEPLQISIRRSVINTSCVAGNDGSITLEVTNGTAPYTYSWSPSVSSSAIAAGLSSGRYEYTVTDANGCVSVGSRNVRDPSQTQTFQDACGSYTWSVTGQTYTTSGTYTSVSDCNPEILYLTVTPGTSNTTTVATCDSYTWSVNGTTYTASGTYTSGTGCNTETLNLTITPNSIVFTTQPANTTICNKYGTVNLTAAIVPISGATYQWQVQTATGTTWDNANNSSVHYSGATTPVLNIQQATAMMNNNKYKLVVTAPSACTVSSDICVLTVNPLPNGAVISGAGTICENSSKTLRIANTLVGSVQWQISTTDTTTGFTDIEGATGNTYTTGALTATAFYRVVISSGVCNSRTSPAVEVTVIPAPVAGTISGGNVTVCAYATLGRDLSNTETPFSNNTLLSVAGTTGAILWQKSTNYENATGATPVWTSALSTINELTVTDLTTDTWYRVIVSNSACSVTSEVVKITVSKLARAGVINSYSNGIVNSASVCTGGDITFTSSAYTGSSIQWEVSTTSPTSGFEAVAGANASTFVMNSISYAPLTSFYVRSVVTSGTCSIARSGFRKVTVYPLSVAGTVTGGGTICSGANKSVAVLGQTGAVQWQSSTDGINYVNVPTGLGTAGVNYTSGSDIGVKGTYLVSNITADTYFRAKITSGLCSEVYSNAVQFTIGTAVVGTLTAANPTVCKGTGTTLTLTGSVGSIKWWKSTNWTSQEPQWTPLSSTAATVLTGNLSVSTAYKAEVTIGSCSIVTTEVVPVMVLAAPLAKPITASVTSPTGTTSALAICTTSTSKVLTIGGGSIGAIQWQKSTTSATLGFVDIADENATSYTVTNPTVGANYFRAKFTNSCGVSVSGSAITVHYKECAPSKAITSVVTGKTSFAVVSNPNPFSNNFNLDVKTSSSEKVSVVLYDMIGRVLEKHLENVSEINTLEIGTNYPAGIYNVIVTQGLEVKTVRVIKK